MNTIKLAGHDVCTGCGACAFKCPRHCISMREDFMGIMLPAIDTASCIECHQCEKACPILNEVETVKPEKAYAAWSNDEEERRTSASGGIAIEMYKQAVRNGYTAVGASQNDDFSVTHKAVSNLEKLTPFKNSKYVFSDAYEVYPEINRLLNEGENVIFIGLPCQVAALRKLFHDPDNLLLVDLVCHGSTPYAYLKQHVDTLSCQAGKTARRMSFRDPSAYTYTYTFTLYDGDNRCFYAKRTKDGDTYQFGYHRAISYRENCYHCRFAQQNRVGDITLADYNGLGRYAPCTYDHKNVSLILENTSRGSAFIEQLVENKRIHAEQRPLEESFESNAQLRHPIKKSIYRLMFERNMAMNGADFEAGIREPLAKYRWNTRLKDMTTLPVRAIRKMKKLLIQTIK